MKNCSQWTSKKPAVALLSVEELPDAAKASQVPSEIAPGPTSLARSVRPSGAPPFDDEESSTAAAREWKAFDLGGRPPREKQARDELPRTSVRRE